MGSKAEAEPAAAGHWGIFLRVSCCQEWLQESPGGVIGSSILDDLHPHIPTTQGHLTVSHISVTPQSGTSAHHMIISDKFISCSIRYEN